MMPSYDVPEEYLRSQWDDQRTRAFLDLPERRLLIAVLADAVRLLQCGGAKDRAEVAAWIRGHPARISFVALCDELHLAVETTARAMLAYGAVRGSRRLRRRITLRRHVDGGWERRSQRRGVPAGVVRVVGSLLA